MIKGIIFDMDGVIADTDNSRCLILKEILAEKGILMQDKDFKKIYGIKTIPALFMLFPNLSESEIRAIAKEKDKRLFSEPQKHIKPIEGMVKVVETLSKSFRLCIVSSSDRRQIASVLKHIGILEQFEGIVSSDDVNSLKPHPEPYLKALELLGLDSEECIVIEDSIHGIESAHAAGIRVIGFSQYQDVDSDFIAYFPQDIIRIVNNL